MPDEEKDKAFRKWYADIVEKLNKKERTIDPNPDDWRHYYDYRSAFKSGDKPKFDEKDKQWHWPSRHKHDLHPNRFVRSEGKWLDTKKDRIVDLRVVEEQKTNRKIYEERKKE